MKTRNLLIAAVLVAAAATSAFAALSTAHVDWGKGPASYFMTNEEKAAWKAVQTDVEADAFIELFWARRDPTPATPRNEFHEDFDARVKVADDQLSHGRLKGSMTDPGRILILFGAPTKAIRRTNTSNGQSNTRSDMRNSEVGSAFQSTNSPDMVWTYEGEVSQKLFGSPHVEMSFHDQYNDGNFKLQIPPVDLAAAQQRIISGLITQPTLTKAPTFQAGGAAPVAKPVAPVAGVKTPALEAALAEAKAGKANDHGAAFAYAEFVSPAGDPFVPVQVYVPGSAGVASDGADTIFGAIEDASGTRVTAFEDPAKLTASRTDFFVDKTLTLQPGKYTAIVGLAKGGAPVLVTSGPIEVAGLSKESVGTSRMILSDNVYELGTAEPPKAPFAFGKLKIVPKGNLIFKASDELNYFVEINNPGIDAATNLPKLQFKLDLTGGPDKKTISAPLSDAAALPLTGAPGPGHYAIISAIPMGEVKPALKPGDYILKMKIVDTVSKQSYTVEQSFKVSG
ncbi:MAG TPA: GWxTD domain-containing protein [Thermoanaerobaculia bacterium]|jgi:GWxTD domain-containing protein|nr:GWxTD domain-containing protein [Thermoanaerobaculia bacterium]